MGINSIIDDNSYDLMQKGLEATTLRAKTIANNIANINTKNYKKFSVVFEENLKKDSDSGFKLKKTNSKHISGTDEPIGQIQIKQDKSRSMRTDGNNIDIEIEKVNQAANTLKYNALITRINNKISTTKSVIK